jgi:hypothetical protein
MMVLKGGGRDQIRNESVGATQKQFFQILKNIGGFKYEKEQKRLFKRDPSKKFSS